MSINLPSKSQESPESVTGAIETPDTVKQWVATMTEPAPREGIKPKESNNSNFSLARLSEISQGLATFGTVLNDRNKEGLHPLVSPEGAERLNNIAGSLNKSERETGTVGEVVGMLNTFARIIDQIGFIKGSIKERPHSLAEAMSAVDTIIVGINNILGENGEDNGSAVTRALRSLEKVVVSKKTYLSRELDAFATEKEPNPLAPEAMLSFGQNLDVAVGKLITEPDSKLFIDQASIKALINIADKFKQGMRSLRELVVLVDTFAGIVEKIPSLRKKGPVRNGTESVSNMLHRIVSIGNGMNDAVFGRKKTVLNKEVPVQGSI